MTLGEDYAQTQKNIARLMVRRYLRSWLDVHEDEDLLITLFVISMREGPNLSMREHAAAVDMSLRAMRQALEQRGVTYEGGVANMRRSFNAYIRQEIEKP
jgi:hypothetical protein